MSSSPCAFRKGMAEATNKGVVECRGSWVLHQGRIPKDRVEPTKNQMQGGTSGQKVEAKDKPKTSQKYAKYKVEPNGKVEAKDKSKIKWNPTARWKPKTSQRQGGTQRQGGSQRPAKDKVEPDGKVEAKDKPKTRWNPKVEAKNRPKTSWNPKTSRYARCSPQLS